MPASSELVADARFALSDPAWLEHLDDKGYVVIKAVATLPEVYRARELIWQDLERVVGNGLSRDDIDSWAEWEVDKRGLTAGAVAQGAGCWAVRGLAPIADAFSQIWACQTDALIVSMDALIIWRPWWGDAPSDWTPVTEVRWPTCARRRCSCNFLITSVALVCCIPTRGCI